MDINKIIDILNLAVEEDQDATTELFTRRFHCQYEKTPFFVREEEDYQTVSVLGVLNGLLPSSPGGNGAITMTISMQKVIGFERSK